MQRVVAQLGVARGDRARAGGGVRGDERRAPAPERPTRCCGTSSVGSRWSVGRVRAAVVDRQPEEQVLGIGLGVLDEDVEVAVVVEDAGVEQLVLRSPRATARVAGAHEIVVGERRLRVLVELLHVRVGRRRVEVEVVLLDVLAVVALAVGQPEQPLLEDRVAAVPERQREAEPLLVVARSRRCRPRPTGRRGSAPGRG